MPPPRLRNAPGTEELTHHLSLMAENANYVLDRLQEELTSGLDAISVGDDGGLVEVYMSNITTAAVEAANTIYHVIMSDEETFRMPSDLSTALEYLKVPWPPLAVDLTTAGIVVAYGAVGVMAADALNQVAVFEEAVFISQEGLTSRIAIDILGVDGIVGVRLAERGGVRGFGLGIQWTEHQKDKRKLAEDRRRVWPTDGVN